MRTTKQQRRQLTKERAGRPLTLALVSPENWPRPLPHGLRQVWVSRDFFVQLYSEGEARCLRLTVNRTEVDGARFRDGITWDEMQRLKAEAGYGDSWAVECYPPDDAVVNVANARHLWLIGPIANGAFGWSSSTPLPGASKDTR